jgi:hypothetical protein
MDERSVRTGATIALGCGVLGVVVALWIYWLVIPGVVLGVAAVVLGVRARRRDAGEMATVALTLGVVALLLVPSVLFIANESEDFGRDCAIDPSGEGC